MEYKTGKSKPMEDVTLEDMQKHPIWTFALDEEEVADHDETWLVPILDASDVKKQFIDVYILLKMEYNDKYLSANLDIKKMTLSDIAAWQESQWQPIDKINNIDFPVYLIASPAIKGETNVKFIVENKWENGRKIYVKNTNNLLWKRICHFLKHLMLMYVLVYPVLK
jgi:hypothetical protein